MKNILKFLLLVILIVGAYYYFTHKKVSPQPEPENIVEEGERVAIEGCYVAGNNQDVYTLTIDSVAEDNTFSGSLYFNNYQKDSSSGTFSGIYEDDVLLGEYNFFSEGMMSTMEVAFKKVGDTFVRGYGPVDEDGTTFVDSNNLSYEEDNLSVFKAAECDEKIPESFTWEFEDDDSLNLDGFPKTNIFLLVRYSDESFERKLIDTLDGGCNEIPEFNDDTVPQSTQIQCYYAGLGYKFKVVKEDDSYLVKRQKFEEASPNYNPPFYEYETVARI